MRVFAGMTIDEVAEIQNVSAPDRQTALVVRPRLARPRTGVVRPASVVIADFFGPEFAPISHCYVPSRNDTSFTMPESETAGKIDFPLGDRDRIADGPSGLSRSGLCRECRVAPRSRGVPPIARNAPAFTREPSVDPADHRFATDCWPPRRHHRPLQALAETRRGRHGRGLGGRADPSRSNGASHSSSSRPAWIRRRSCADSKPSGRRSR